MSRRFLISALISFMAASVLAAGTNAEIPYKSIDQLCEIISGIDQTKLAVTVRVGSTNKNVHQSDIRLTIQSMSGAIPIAVNTNGQLLNFPHRKDLVRENPPVVSNQPKGSLNLVMMVRFVVPDGLTFRYSRLTGGIQEANKAIKAQAGMLSFFAPKADGMILIFPTNSAGKAKVEIESAAGRREYIADKDGQVKLKLEKALASENPEVKVSETMLGIIPVIE